MKVILKIQFDVDVYDEKEFYYGEIIHDNKVIYSHELDLKSFSYKDDAIRHLHIKCAELDLEVSEVIDETYIPSMWEEQI